MQLLRQSFKLYQNDVYQKKPTFPTSIKVQKSIKLAEQEINNMQNTNDFTNFDEAVFYKEKFAAINHITQNYEKKKISKDSFQDQIRTLLAKDYTGISIVQSKLADNNKAPNQPLTVPATSGYRSKNKSPLKQFFDQQQIKNSNNKVMFSNILSRDETPLKFGLRSVNRSKSPINKNNLNQSELRRLKQENERLRNQLDADRSVHSNEDRLRQLKSQISELSEENRRLKVEVSSRSGTRSDYMPEEEYDPYNIKVRENNIMRINSRNLSMSEKMSQYGEEFRPLKGSHIYYDNQSEIFKSDFTHNPLRYSQRKLNQPAETDLLNSSHSTIQTHFLNLDQSQLHDEQKNHVCRQKIAFFKKSMVLYKGQDFDIAFKRSDMNAELDRLRIILYVNNKSQSKVDCKIEYDFQRDDFDLMIKKKIQRVDGRGQGREEIEVMLRNSTDLGSLIIAKVLVGSVMKKIILPALFIDFDPNYKHQFQNIGYIQRNLTQPLTIKPMGQFSSLQKASNILQLSRQYDNNRYVVAKLYGKSKVTKGIVRLTWKNDKLRIETCQEWRTLMGYLFLNAEETILY